MNRIKGKFCALLLLLLTVHCHVHGAMMLSASKEAEIGKEIYDKVTAEMPVYKDPQLNAYVRAVGEKLVTHSDSPDTKFTFTILDNPDINAFATPGAYVYINRGLITYLSSEAQLAAVMAHEIAHVTARHAARQKRAQTTSNIAAGVLAILSRSSEVGEATALWGAATVRGYGRDMELEADGLGATFMSRAGYDRNAMIEVITLLKDHERLEKKRARDSGREPQTYHGLFATHPRNDKRLREMVSSGDNTIDNPTGGEKGVIPFRVATDNLIWGENFQAKVDKPNRYSDEKHLFRLDFPETWTYAATANGVKGTAPENSGSLEISIKARTLQAPEAFLKTTLNIGVLKKPQPFKIYGLAGHTGMAPRQNGNDNRVAVIYYQRYALLFEGNVTANKKAKELDNAFLQILQSFAPLSAAQLAHREPQRIHYVKATAHTTFADLARYLKLGKYGEEELRLINGYYPRGEPPEGSWIKIIR